nr:hypothetical protein GCM10025699_48340 [Microbacterium flavescens]
MAADEAEFGTELRGYRKEEVDRALNDLRRELIKSNADRAEVASELGRMQVRLDDLQSELDEAGTPTYSGLGSKLEQTLRLAEQQATRLVSQADIDAEELRRSSGAEAERLVSDATERADALLNDARGRASAQIDESRAEADRMVARARNEVRSLLQEAQRDSSAMRGAAATEAAENVSTARHEAAALRADVERDVAEQRAVVGREVAEARDGAAELARTTEETRALFVSDSERQRADLEREETPSAPSWRDSTRRPGPSSTSR